MQELDKSSRQEVAAEIWKLFCIISSKVELFFTEKGVSITVRFNEPHKLGDGTRSVGAIVKGFHDYTEAETAALVPLPSEHDS